MLLWSLRVENSVFIPIYFYLSGPLSVYEFTKTQRTKERNANPAENFTIQRKCQTNQFLLAHKNLEML